MESHHHQHAQHHSAAETDAAMAELLDLDAEVMHSYLAEVTAWTRSLAADPPPRRILDLGSGTGAGAFALLERFDQADVIAVDVSAEMLRRLSSKARVLGVAGRIRTVQADLDTARPAIDAVDLVWASSSLHHMADPDRVLAGVFGTLRPGGLLVVAEMVSFPRFLPDDLGLGRPGLEARCHAALAERRPASCRIAVPTGARACPRPASPSTPSGLSSSTWPRRCPPPPAGTPRPPCDVSGPASTAG